MGLCIAGNLPKATAMARERIHLRMDQHILVNGPKDDTMESDNVYGWMAEYTRENGEMGRHMDTVWKNESMERYDMKACGITIFQSENDDAESTMIPSHSNGILLTHVVGS
jgi:hypothetical protein